MTKIISCPSCNRRLSVDLHLSAEQPLKCPACATVFALPRDTRRVEAEEIDDVEDVMPWPRDSTDFTASGPRPVRLRAGANGLDERPSRAGNWENDDDGWLQLRRPARKGRRNLLLGVGGVAVLLLMIAAVLFFNRGQSSNELVGSWKGTFQIGVMNIDCIYRFRADGTMVDEHMEPPGIMVEAKGRYTFRNGKINIGWSNGGFEKATVRRTGPNTIEYTIRDHTDIAQIGCTATFTRVPTRRS